MTKEIIFVGLGRMGLAMASHLVESGFAVHGFDHSRSAADAAKKSGINTYNSLAEAVSAMQSPKTVWLMIPAIYVSETLEALIPVLSEGDTIIDGGNSFFKHSLERHHNLNEHKINFIDCGTSGGVEGARHGASLMVGGEKKVVLNHEHIFKALAVKGGYGHVGGPASGHFAKMVHNGIEYGMMGAIAEGMNVLHEHKDTLQLNIHETLKPYNHGSIIDSRLVRWLENAYHTQGYLEDIAGEVPKGETEMEMEYLIEHEDVVVLEAALNQRRATRIKPTFIGTLISAMRNQFGSHKTFSRKAGE